MIDEVKRLMKLMDKASTVESRRRAFRIWSLRNIDIAIVFAIAVPPLVDRFSETDGYGIRIGCVLAAYATFAIIWLTVRMSFDPSQNYYP